MTRRSQDARIDTPRHCKHETNEDIIKNGFLNGSGKESNTWRATTRDLSLNPKTTALASYMRGASRRKAPGKRRPSRGELFAVRKVAAWLSD